MWTRLKPRWTRSWWCRWLLLPHDDWLTLRRVKIELKSWYRKMKSAQIEENWYLSPQMNWQKCSSEYSKQNYMFWRDVVRINECRLRVGQVGTVIWNTSIVNLLPTFLFAECLHQSLSMSCVDGTMKTDTLCVRRVQMCMKRRLSWDTKVVCCLHTVWHLSIIVSPYSWPMGRQTHKKAINYVFLTAFDCSDHRSTYSHPFCCHSI